MSNQNEKQMILIVSAEMKLNNQVIEVLENEISNVVYVEVSYIEDINEAIFEHSPDRIIIYDMVATKKGYTNMQKDAYYYDYILNDLKGLDVVLLTDKMVTERLNNQLTKVGFFSLCPISKLDQYLLNPPKNLEEVNEAFTDQQNIQSFQPVSNIVEDGESDSFLVPPTALTAKKIPTFAINNSPVEPLTYEDSAASDSLRLHNESNRPIVSVFWSPIPNVGVNSLIKSTAVSLAKRNRKVLMVELDFAYPKLARSTYLTHKDRNIEKSFQALMNNENGVEEFVVNNQLATEELPYKIMNQAKPSLRMLPESLYALSRNADIGYIEEPEIDDDRMIEKLFFQARQAGFNNILVDVPSSPNNLLTTLSFLGADERFVVVDNSYSTAILYQNALEALKIIDINENDFQLIVNKTSDQISANDISMYYQRTPILELPFCEDLPLNQRALQLEGGIEYMSAIEEFILRYGVEEKESRKKKKIFGMFGA